MDYKDVTVSWLKGLRTFGLIIAGLLTFGFTWVLVAKTWSRSFKEEKVFEACETWLGFWRLAAFIILGLVTFGYTWTMISRFETVILSSWRKKLREKGHRGI